MIDVEIYISILVFFLRERSLRILLTTRELWLCNLPLKEHNNMNCCYFKSSFQSLHHNSKHDPPCPLFLMCLLFKPFLLLSQIFPYNQIPIIPLIWIILRGECFYHFRPLDRIINHQYHHQQVQFIFINYFFYECNNI